MHLISKRVVESGCATRGEVLERLDYWARRYGFQRTEDREDDFTYCRGSHWHAFYTFDIRKVPTEVRVRFISDGLGTCVCNLSCGSWFQFSTPGDPKRVSDEMDLLEACLKGAFSDTKANPEIGEERRRERNRGSHDIQESDGRGR